MKKLYKRFCKLDTDNSGFLEPEEFFGLKDLGENPLVRRVIKIFDKNGDGKISFVEFVQGLANLSSNGNDEDKIKFAFQVYDQNRDEHISNGDLFAVLKLMVGNNLNDVQLQQIVDRTIVKSDTTGSGKINYPDFCKMIKELDIARKLTLDY